MSTTIEKKLERFSELKAELEEAGRWVTKIEGEREQLERQQQEALAEAGVETAEELDDKIQEEERRLDDAISEIEEILRTVNEAREKYESYTEDEVPVGPDTAETGDGGDDDFGLE